MSKTAFLLQKTGIFFSIGSRQIGHNSSVGEQMSHVPWPHKNITFLCRSKQIVHVFTDSISFTLASRDLRDESRSSYLTLSASVGAESGCKSG